MPFKKGQIANPKGARKPRLIYDALIMELKSEGPEMPDLRRIARRAIEQAKDGNEQARQWVSDRTEGKVPQGVVGAGEDDLAIQVHHTIVRKIVTP